MANVTFKLPDDLMEALEERAKRFKGTSRHQLAQQVVVDYLKDTRSEQIRDELIELQNELNRLRDNLASSTEVLLQKAGKIDYKEARSWVAKTFY